ncbi:helix-turn-helix domain-containing protein [Candidatus Nitronereus thalassa]|uniref:Helix-turn-helix domain-containing protein n=1 Tax=Candidatus Nitronereus thalassa TaxID=3020898 RepID=A0ABU3K380_9BACT|nr:helix-turn-helix domain-containing protein [Candidatus Nitronereus thalassa]MDT7040829.1 helix-turn-helix domain-containing protein [Candidatus Nitronereus thalassa]
MRIYSASPMLRTKNQHSLRIRSELTRRGWTMADVARRVGCHRSLVTRTVSGETYSPRVVRLLAKIIGVPKKELFPGQVPPRST